MSLNKYIIRIKEFSANSSGSDVCLNIKSLNIENGKIYALLGRSGSGKSLLLSLLSGFPHYDWIGKDRIAFRHFELYGKGLKPTDFASNLKLRKAFEDDSSGKIIYMPQNLPRDVDNHTSISNEIVFILKAIDQNVSSDEIESVKAALEKNISKGILKKTISSLSGGERKRLEILLRIFGVKFFADKNRHAKIALLLDEPTSGVDVKAEQEFMTFIADNFSIIRENATLVISTHALHLLESGKRYFDEIILTDECCVKEQLCFQNMKELVNEAFCY